MKRKFLRNIRLWWLLLAGLLFAALLVWQLTRWAYNTALDDLVETSGERLTLYAGTLRGALNQYAYLPYILSRQADVRILLKSSFNAELVNRYLEALDRQAGSEALYVMNAVGDTLAASNWRDTQSFVGRNYGFRPYFTDAKAGKKGQQFGVGATTGIPGYFMSHPVVENGKFLGATVVKVDLTPLQEGWREGGETVMVSDANGVLFLSSRDDWRYKTLAPLSEAQRTLMMAGRKYGPWALDLLPLTTVRTLGATRKLVQFENRRYMMQSRTLQDFGWQIHHLMPMTPVRERGQAVAVIGTVLALLLLALGLYLRERRQKQISRRQARQARAIQAMNLRLKAEVAERTRTEQVLRETQAELVQAGKLAALGHMAAGIVHELNQPIAAIRTHAASGKLLLQRHEHEKVRETLVAVTRMTEHMASITAQLKTFAHKAPKQNNNVIPLPDCLDGALAMTAGLLEERAVELRKRIAQQRLLVKGDTGRLKQVFINLIRNAVDAMQGSSRPLLEIDMFTDGDEAVVMFADSGSGVEEQNMEELFTPFFTTKEVGEGLGLGLAISYRIITDLGGALKVQNRENRGAVFSVRLPAFADEGKSDDENESNLSG